MRSKLQLSALAGSLLCVGGCRCERASAPAESASAADAAPPRLETWDQCVAGAQTVTRLELGAARLGTVFLDDGGCDWLTAASDGGTRVVRRHRIFGTLRRFDASRGVTVTAPDERVISEQVTSKAESVEWYDDDGEGPRELERRITFGPDGDAQRVEEFFFDDAGARSERLVREAAKRTVHQHFVDGGWRTMSESDAAPGCAYEPIVPIRVPVQ